VKRKRRRKQERKRKGKKFYPIYVRVAPRIDGDNVTSLLLVIGVRLFSFSLCEGWKDNESYRY